MESTTMLKPSPSTNGKTITFASEKERADYLQKMLTDLLMENPREIGYIASSPEEIDGVTYYRISLEGGGNDIIGVLPKGIAGITHKDLKIGTPVMHMRAKIVGLLPKSLERQVEMPTYKLNTWDEIGGVKDQIGRIRDSIELPLKHPELYQEMGIDPLKGVMLYGKPGNGKTMIAKAIASTILGKTTVSKDAFIYVKGAELLNPLVGVAEKSIKDMFTRTRKYYKTNKHRAIIFIDEADAILPTRGQRLFSDVFSTIVPTFLSEMDGFDDHSPFIILATNRPEVIDPAVLREGRIDQKIEILPPTKDEFTEIMEIKLSSTKVLEDTTTLAGRASDLVFEQLSSRVSGALAGAVVKFATQSSIKRAVSEKEKKMGIRETDIDYAVDQLKSSEI